MKNKKVNLIFNILSSIIEIIFIIIIQEANDELNENINERLKHLNDLKWKKIEEEEKLHVLTEYRSKIAGNDASGSSSVRITELEKGFYFAINDILS